MTRAPATVPCLALELPARPESVREVRRRVREFAAEHGAAGGVLSAIELAASEAASNAVVHAYAGQTGTVRVEADVEGGEFELVVADDGCGFTGLPSPGLGLGLAFVRWDECAVEIRDRPLGGVEVWARFLLAA